MRLRTLLLVLFLGLATVAAFANGHTPVQPETPEVTTPTTPEGMGPAPTTPTVVVPSTCGTCITPAVCPTGTMPQPTSSVEVFNTNLATTNFGVDAASVTGLRQAGWAWGDIYILANIAQKSSRPILEIANLRSQGMAYDQIACRYNLAANDILCAPPCAVQTKVAGFTGQYGYAPLYFRTDPWGNPVCTRWDAERLSRMGYGWTAIASAANVAAVTGARCEDVLAWVDRGYTWQQIACMYGLNADCVTNVSLYPFGRGSGFGSCGEPTCNECNTCPPVQPCNPCPPANPCATTCPPANPCGPVTTAPVGAGPGCGCPSCQTGNPCDTCPQNAPCNQCPPAQPTCPCQ